MNGASLKIGFFASDDDLRYQDEVTGNLFVQVEKTMDLLYTKYLKAVISYQGLQRVETYPFPRAAVREALLNAVVHKDYSTGIPTQIKVYAHQLVLWNAGHLSPDWSVERLLGSHPSLPFNPLIANAFFRAGYIESWGRGIQKIQEECRVHGIAGPEVDAGLSGLMLTFKASVGYLKAIQNDPGTGARPAEQGRNASENSVKTSVKTPDRIIEILSRNPHRTLADIASEIDKSVRAVEMACTKLVKAQRIRHVGPQKGGHWEVIQ